MISWLEMLATVGHFLKKRRVGMQGLTIPLFALRQDMSSTCTCDGSLKIVDEGFL
jgi:hypothetical protein